MGIAIRGRLAGFSQTKAQFSGSLRNVCVLADLKMDRLLNTIDQWVSENGLDREIEPPLRYLRTKTEDSPPLLMDFDKDKVKTILWATGYRPDYSWLHIPIFNARGKIRHQGGVIDAPGMYLLGMPLLRRRKSSFIHGAEDDARDLSAHISDYLENLSRSDSLFDPLRPVHIAA
jgi:putative flavoprotein involved in K+ transport